MRDQKKMLQALVDAGQLTDRAVKRFLLPKDELLALLDSDAQKEVVADLNSVLNAVSRAGAKKRRH